MRLAEVSIFAEGVAVAETGKLAFAIAKDPVDPVDLVDPVITVTTDEMCAEIRYIYDMRAITQPADACALAGLKKYIEREDTNGQTSISIHNGVSVISTVCTICLNALNYVKIAKPLLPWKSLSHQTVLKTFAKR